MTWLLVGLAAAIGAPARYLIDRAVQARHAGVLPLGTLAVNLIASFGLGLLAGAGGSVSADWYAFAGTGLCATLSTYSTFAYETMRLGQVSKVNAAANVAVSVLAGVGLASLGFVLTS